MELIDWWLVLLNIEVAASWYMTHIRLRRIEKELAKSGAALVNWAATRSSSTSRPLR